MTLEERKVDLERQIRAQQDETFAAMYRAYRALSKIDNQRARAACVEIEGYLNEVETGADS
jgi:hypothetical protein